MHVSGERLLPRPGGSSFIGARRPNAFSLCFGVAASLVLSGCGRSDGGAVTARAAGVALPADVRFIPAGTGTGSAPETGEVTFCRDIAPVVYEKCSRCHREGEAAPFVLLTSNDLRKRAGQIVEVVERRIMPPWLPDHGAAAFADDMSLSDAQVRLFRCWMEQGTPEGDAADLPAPPAAAASGWKLGKPDLVISMPEGFRVAPDGNDAFHSFVFPMPFSETKYVRTYEFHPGNPRVVHHANLMVDRSSVAKLLDERDPSLGFAGMVEQEQLGGLDVMFNGWAPGIEPWPGADGIAARIEPGEDLVLQMHLAPSGKWEDVRAEIGLYFADRPPTQHAQLVRMSSYTIDVPAGASRHIVRDEYTMPVAAEAIGVNPHAHHRVTEIRAFAEFPDGSRQWLLKISRWDFNWQGSYRYAQPIRLPKGTRVVAEFTFDNSASNPRNPSLPPVRAMYGPETKDEMADVWLQLVTANAADSRRLRVDAALVDLERRIDGFELIVTQHPNSDRRAAAHAKLGELFVGAGLKADALDHFRRATELKPDHAAAWFHHARALIDLGRLDEAGNALARVLRLAPKHAASYYWLGRIHEVKSDGQTASRYFQEAVRLEPGFKPARQRLRGFENNLGKDHDEQARKRNS
jgi:hypothetical protein